MSWEGPEYSETETIFNWDGRHHSKRFWEDYVEDERNVSLYNRNADKFVEALEEARSGLKWCNIHFRTDYDGDIYMYVMGWRPATEEELTKRDEKRRERREFEEKLKREKEQEKLELIEEIKKDPTLWAHLREQVLGSEGEEYGSG